MICERLIGLVKNWYLNVQEETMAPARMVSFMEQHIRSCEVCQDDPDIEAEFLKIRDIVLPASKKVPNTTEADEDQGDAGTVDDVVDEDIKDVDEDVVDDEDDEI
jgi:hypothetical protein